MSENSINCPKCGYQIPIDQILVQRMKEQVNDRVLQEIAKKEAELKKQFTEEQSTATKALQAQLFAEKQKREEAQKKELDFIKTQTELEDKLKNTELEIARRLQEERNSLMEKAQKDAESQYQLKIMEKEKQLEDTKKALFEAQRKAQQGSMQTQGEVLELSLEELLKQTFPLDKIEPVPKGINGADIIHTVYNQTGQPCGTIAWESKHTKNWTEEWIQKLKDDSRNIKADVSILVSETLPKNINHVGHYNGIWVCDFPSACGLATALRSQLLAVSNAIVAETGKDQKMEAIYSYLTSNAFAQKVEALVETFINMRSSLEKEKIAMNRIWSSRETQIMRLTENTAKMYGEIQGIAGAALPSIELLELEGAGLPNEALAKLGENTPEPADKPVKSHPDTKQKPKPKPDPQSALFQ